jgi:hypothetical protein
MEDIIMVINYPIKTETMHEILFNDSTDPRLKAFSGGIADCINAGFEAGKNCGANRNYHKDLYLTDVKKLMKRNTKMHKYLLNYNLYNNLIKAIGAAYDMGYEEGIQYESISEMHAKEAAHRIAEDVENARKARGLTR